MILDRREDQRCAELKEVFPKELRLLTTYHFYTFVQSPILSQNSKAALLGLTHSLASSLAPQIRVNAILPGWIPSGHESKEGDEKNLKWDHELTEADQNQHWTGRAGKVEDFYKTVLYLSECGFITGQQIVVDGGMTKKMIYEE